jgi:hypothetical protein
VASDVEIKPGPPWEPSAEAAPVVAATGKWDMNDPGDRRTRSQVRWSVAFLAVVFAGFAFAIAFNFGQAARTGGGSGFGDTTLLPQPEAERFFETHNVPDSNR